jgi:hypothetical protein
VSPTSLPSADELRAIRDREGVDAATALLYRAVRDAPRQRAFLDALKARRREAEPSPPPGDVRLAIVPGAFYREHAHSGADGRTVREEAGRLGWPVDLIPVASTGSILGNAAEICRWLAARRDCRIVLVSLSKGGSDLKLALRQPGAGEVFRRVAAWINLCGILDGTPMADWMLSRHPGAVLNRLYYRVLGVDLEFLRDLRRGPGSLLAAELEIPAHLQMISIVGFPQRRHLTSAMARRCHARLAVHGPNDGVIVLADACSLPGLIYPVWGADHYLRSGEDMAPLLRAILGFVGRELAACPPARSLTIAAG